MTGNRSGWTMGRTATFLAGVAGGGTLGACLAAAERGLGTAPSALATIVLVLASFTALGLLRQGRHRGRKGTLGAAMAARLAGLGSLALVLPVVAHPQGAAIRWAGGGLEAGPVALFFARVLVSLPVLAPAGLLAGSLLRIRVVRFSASGPCSIPTWLALGGIAGFVIPRVVALFGAPLAGVAITAAILCLILALLFRLRGGPRLDSAEEARPQERTPIPAIVGNGLLASAVAFALTTSDFLSARVFLFAFGNELPRVPLVPALFGVGMLVGALAAMFAHRIRSAALGTTLATLAGAAAGLVLLRPFDRLPARFLAAIAESDSLQEVLQAALPMTFPLVLPAAVLLGAGLLWLAARPPASVAERLPWILQRVLGVGAGAVVGILCARVPLAGLGLEGTLTTAVLVSALLAAAGFTLTGGFSWRRLAIGVTGIAAVAALSVRLPTPDRSALLVERDLVSQESLSPAVQKNWCFFDEDDTPHSVAVLRRGGARRLLVNGRYEVSNGSERKSLGALAHLPLLIHPAPRSVLLIGTGNGAALGAVLSHPVKRIDCLAASRGEVRGTARFGREVEQGLRDPRVHVHVGNLTDLVGRAQKYDVIASQPAGAWTERSAALMTREQLALAAGRLADDGVLCHWQPASSLTKTGFKILLATFASVFPAVEVWDGGGGDVLVLARQERDLLDAERILAGFHRPETAAGLRNSWLADPIVLFSHFLVGDTSVRRITAGSPLHTRESDALGSAEADRRRTEPTVDPVPGLAAIRGDVLAHLRNSPTDGFAEALRLGIEARNLERQALTLELEQDWLAAADLYERALEMSPRDGSLRRALATLRTRMGIEYATQRAFTAAHANMRQAVETDTTYAEGFANLGNLLLMNETFDYAISVTHQAAALEPDNDLVWLQLGRIWKRRGYFDEAMPFYERAMAANPLNVDAAMGYIDNKLKMEEDFADLEGALAFMRGYVPLEPANQDLLLRIQRLELAISRGDRAPPAETEARSGD